MFKKFVAWVKALFAPAKISDAKVDEYIARQSRKIVKSSVETADKSVKVGTSPPRRGTPPKRLDDKLKDVELPVYARGKELPPKAKRQFIEQAKRRPASNSSSTLKTSSVVQSDTPSAALYGYGVLASEAARQDSDPVVSSCRSSSHSGSSSYDYGSSDSGSSSSSSCD